MPVDSSYILCLVKKNDGKTIRLARMSDIIGDVKQEDRLEILIKDLIPSEVNNKLWQTNCLIWFAPGKSNWYEATRDDAIAEHNYQLALKKVKDFVDLDPENGIDGNLLIVGASKYQVVDGVGR